MSNVDERRKRVGELRREAWSYRPIAQELGVTLWLANV